MELAPSSALPARSAFPSAGFDECQHQCTRMHAGVWAYLRIRHVRSSTSCLQCLLSVLVFLVAVQATHGVKETAGNVKAVPEVVVVEIAVVTDEIRAAIFCRNMWMHVSRSSWSTRLFAGS